MTKLKELQQLKAAITGNAESNLSQSEVNFLHMIGATPRRLLSGTLTLLTVIKDDRKKLDRILLKLGARNITIIELSNLDANL